uniref:Fatty-acid and retinol-binding protein 1 n=1 Tax=Heligmosomoides polygyrus TaxID=6339 RepID=Q962H2_HELPZ|nr:putative retinol-binding protein [Heligmosomoides polygyrus]
MLRLGFLALLIVCVCSTPIKKAEDIPQEVREVLPENVVQLILSFTPAEKKVIEEFFNNWEKFKTEDEALNFFKEKSPSLYAKIENLREILKKKVATLSPESKAFFDKVQSSLKDLHKQILVGDAPSLDMFREVLRKHVDTYKALSADSKKELKKTFPIAARVMSKLVGSN